MSTAAPPLKPARVKTCADCGHEIPISRTGCPHCARPLLFPNVDLARDAPEKEKLEARYAAAVEDVRNRGCEEIARQFETACTQSKAVFGCTIERLFREVATGTQIYETYQDLERLRLHTSIPASLDWERLRSQTEIELLGTPTHLDKLHYACLSLNGMGLTNYGECAVELADTMISHRATCFEGNSAVIYAKTHTFSACLRCEWADRNKMCVAVLASRLDGTTRPEDLCQILVENGAKPEDDVFIEVHVFGPMTARTFRAVRVYATTLSRSQKVLLEAIEQKLGGVPLEVDGLP